MIGSSIQALIEPFPKEIDILRLYYGQPRNIPEKNKISVIIKQIEKIYIECGLRVKSLETIRLKTKRFVASCKKFIASRKSYQKSKAEKKARDFSEKHSKCV